MGTPRAVGGQAELCTPRGGAAAGGGGVWQPGELACALACCVGAQPGYNPLAPLRQESLHCPPWLPSAVCLSVCPSVTSGSAHLFPVVSQLLTVNSWLPWDLMMSREREGHPGARAHARVVRAVMPRSRATRVGAHPFLPLPLHSVELASQPVPKSRPAVPATVSPLLTMGPRSLPPRRAACPCLPPHHTAWIGGASTMTPASSGEAVALGPWDRAWCPPGSQQASSHSTSVS